MPQLSPHDFTILETKNRVCDQYSFLLIIPVSIHLLEIIEEQKLILSSIKVIDVVLLKLTIYFYFVEKSFFTSLPD